MYICELGLIFYVLNVVVVVDVIVLFCNFVRDLSMWVDLSSFFVCCEFGVVCFVVFLCLF